ncbi:MAG TPA: nucleotidyltransferase family protein [Bacteroidales bacterium]|nr:nucleotidyltransferase family protein [Bacteroidales bacterium]
MNLQGIVILAAGASTRLGKPKQLLQYEGNNLIQRITQIAVDVVNEPVVVVLGAHSDLIRPHISRLPVSIVYNPDWTSGIGSSIRKGLREVLDLSPDLDSVLFAVCDQPHVSRELFADMISTRINTKKPIVACSYGNTLGTPVLFSKQYFGELMRLKNFEGARKIIQRHTAAVESVPFPLGKVDIDTLQDYIALGYNNTQ